LQNEVLDREPAAGELGRMSLIQDLQQQRLHGPLSRRFSLRDWVGQGTRPDLVDGEMEVIALGALFHASLDHLRNALRLVSRDDLPASTKRRALVALANRECLMSEVILTEKLTAGLPPGAVVFMDRIATETITLLGGEFRADEIAETNVDAAERLIVMCGIAPDDPVAEEAPPPFEQVAPDLNIAGSYLSNEALWMDVVWNGFRVDRKQPPLTLGPVDRGPECFAAVSRHRHLMTSTQAHSSVFARGRGAPGTEAASHPLTITAHIEAGHAQLAGVAATVDKAARRDANRVSAVPPYYEPVLNVPSPLQAPLTLGLVFDTFNLLSEVAHDLASGPLVSLRRERKGGDVLAHPLELAPWLSRAQLIDRVSEALEISADLARQVIGFLTFADPGEVRTDVPTDVSSAPLVYGGADGLVVMINPLRNGNLRWTVDRWLRRLGFPLDFRGTEFEDYARTVLRADAAESALSGVCTIHPAGFEFVTATGRAEEIDILAVVNDLIIVAEAKCFLEPVAPIERRNHREKIAEAAAQVRRKAVAVDESREQFRRRAEQLGFPAPANYRVMPLVVLNHALGAGQVVDGVAVVDLSIYSLFFKGSMQWMAVFDPAGNVESALVEYFFEAPATASQALERYLVDPPQVRHLRGALVPRRCGRLFPALSHGVIYSMEWDIDPARIQPPEAVRMGKGPPAAPKRSKPRRGKRRNRSRRR
jgi:hypothetical protein